MTALLFLVVLFAIIVLAVFTLSWALRWPSRSDRWIVIATFYGLAVFGLGAAWFIGLLSPIESYTAQRKIRTLERHLYVGESRADLEKQFGHGIPTPDRVKRGSGNYVYEYTSATGICMQQFDGLNVVYSAHGDHIGSWEPVKDGYGC